MTAAQNALSDGDYALAAQRLIYARDADPGNVPVLRMMTLAFWQADNLPAAARAVRDWARVDGDRPAAHRFAARIYEDMGAIDLAAEAAERAVARAPRRRQRVGAARPPAPAPDGPRRRDRGAAARAGLEPSVEALLDLALALQLAGDIGGEVSACEQAVELDAESLPAWSRLAHALARTDRVAECLEACERALELGGGAEVAELRERMARLEPRVLPAA